MRRRSPPRSRQSRERRLVLAGVWGHAASGARGLDTRGRCAGPAPMAGSQVHLGSGRARRVMSGQAVVLLSGGLDSATAAALARKDGWTLNALTIRYGQVHAVELEAARQLAMALGVARHVELDVD